MGSVMRKSECITAVMVFLPPAAEARDTSAQDNASADGAMPKALRSFLREMRNIRRLPMSPLAPRRHCERSDPSTLAARASRGGRLPKRLSAEAEAVQGLEKRMDCFVATLLAMTASSPRAIAYDSLFSIFQKIGVAGPSSTPVSDLRQALGASNWPSGM